MSNDISFVKGIAGDNLSLLCSWVPVSVRDTRSHMYCSYVMSCSSSTRVSFLKLGKTPAYIILFPHLTQGFELSRWPSVWLSVTHFCICLQDFPSLENHSKIFHETSFYVGDSCQAWLETVSKHVWQIHGTRTIGKYFISSIYNDVVY